MLPESPRRAYDNIPSGFTLQHTLQVSNQVICYLAWSPDGQVLAACSCSGIRTIQLWNAQTGQQLQTLTELSSTSFSIAISPDSCLLTSGDFDGSIDVLDLHTGQLIRTLSEHSDIVTSLAWSPDGQTLASGSEDKTIRLWNPNTGKQISTLEGHTKKVNSVSFSNDGRLFASKSNDSTVRIWRTDMWKAVATLEEATRDTGFSYLAFHPKSPILASLGKDNMLIHIWNLDVDTFLETASTTSTIHYTTAKIALVGDSHVGKSGLGYRIAEDHFQITESTHGQQFWVVDKLSKTRRNGTQCEVLLWDFAGQPNFRPIHSLFLEDVDLALVLFDPARPDTLTGVDYWLKQLSHNRQLCRSILVAARIDVSPLSTSSTELEVFCRERNISGGFVATSAKNSEGIDKLLERIGEQIDWDAKIATVTTETFKRIKDYVLALKADANRKNVLVSPAQLRRQLESTDPNWEFNNEQMMTAVGHLQNHGYVTVLHRSLNEQRILLVPDVLINLAASYMLKAQTNEKWLGALEELHALHNEYKFREVENLSEDERDTLLNAVTELFLNRNICFRESVDNRTFLIFPSLIFDRPPRMVEDTELIEDFTYVVTGLVENVYPALVVLLGYAPNFQRTNQWHKQAQYETPHGAICSFKQANDKPGELELVLHYGKNTPNFVRQRFQGLFEEILYTRHVTIEKYAPIFCPMCGCQQERRTVIKCIKEGKKILFCYQDGTKIHLQNINERAALSSEGRAIVMRDQALSNMRTTYETALVRVKSFIRDRRYDTAAPTCFVSYAWGYREHEQWILRLIDDLQNADIDVTVDRVNNLVTRSDTQHFASCIEQSEFIIVVGTPAYYDKYENKNPHYGSMVATEIDLINARLVGAKAQKESILPVLLAGKAEGSIPAEGSFPKLLQKSRYSDFSHEEYYFTALFDLMLTIYRIPFDNSLVRDLRSKVAEEARALRTVLTAQAREHVFISYCHKDKKWLDRLQIMLKPLVRQGMIKTWSDSQIEPGGKWQEEISRALASARVAVLLVTPNFLASDFIANNELPPLLEAAKKEGVVILWIAISASMYKVTPINTYRAVNNPSEPLDSLTPANLNKEMVRICESISKSAYLLNNWG